MQTYGAYGLSIRSEIPLPELVAAPSGTADVTVRAGSTGYRRPATGADGCFFRLAPNEAYFFWDDVGAFLVRNGNEIVIDALPGVAENVIRLPLLGMALAAIIQQRGLLALHASAVSVGGRAVAFLGAHRLGKSTTAAAMCARGHTLLADDLAVLDLSGRAPLVLPGFPQLKLFPDAAAASLGDDPDRLPPLAAGFAKCGRPVGEGFSLDPVPLRAIFLLDFSPHREIEPTGPQEAVTHLIGQSYVARVFKNELRGAEAARNLLQCARVAKDVRVSWLRREPSLGVLADLAREVEQYLERETRPVAITTAAGSNTGLGGEPL
jgi:hypothetical protein